MPDNPLKSFNNYSRFIAELLNRPAVKHSTLSVWSDSPYTGIAEGDVFFTNGLRMRIREELDFLEGIIIIIIKEAFKQDIQRSVYFCAGEGIIFMIFAWHLFWHLFSS